jgi:pyrrolidone-carboxylate peptidase
MSLIGHIRRMRWVPRAALAMLLLAAIQTALLPCAMATNAGVAMTDHCVYCPPAVSSDSDSVDANSSSCAFIHGPAVDVFAASAHQIAQLMDSPCLQPVTFDLHDLRQTQSLPNTRNTEVALTAAPRPLTLTYCVQLK